MIFEATPLPPSTVVELEPFVDERGLFARLACEDDFAAHGLNGRFVQTSLSVTHQRDTIRGLHFQIAPSSEAKLVRCLKGRIWDVIVDLRPAAATFCRHLSVELDSTSRRGLYVPSGFAHGFLTLTDEAEVLYQMTDSYRAELSRGVRWNDPAFGVRWPVTNPHLNARDATYPDFDTGLVCGFAGL